MKNKRDNPYPMLTEQEQIDMPLEALVAFDECLIYADLLEYGNKRIRQLLDRCERNPFKLRKYLKNIINAKLDKHEEEAIKEVKTISEIKPEAVKPEENG